MCKQLRIGWMHWYHLQKRQTGYEWSIQKKPHNLPNMNHVTSRPLPMHSRDPGTLPQPVYSHTMAFHLRRIRRLEFALDCYVLQTLTDD